MSTQEKKQSDMNAIEQENKLKSTLVDIEEITGTPFKIVTIPEKKENKSFIAVGQDRLSEYGNYEELLTKIHNRDWELIAQLMVMISDKIKNENQN